MKISILTKAAPFDNYFQLLKQCIVNPIDTISIIRNQKNIYGHAAVTNSVLRGLRATRTKSNYNPLVCSNISPIVVVLSDIDALKQCIKLKQTNKRMKILAGPNLMIWSNEYDGILADTSLDIILVPSQWVKTAYLEDNKLIKPAKIFLWPAGVDVDYWKPSNHSRSSKVLVYYKNSSKKLFEQVKQLVKKLNKDLVVVRYGDYSESTYRKCLDSSNLAIFLSQSESQGIALAEAWAMDVPTLVWDPKKLTYKGRVYSSVTSAPYLQPKTGLKWKQIDELIRLFDRIDSDAVSFAPREWVLENMTDSVSAKYLVQIIREIPVC